MTVAVCTYCSLMQLIDTNQGDWLFNKWLSLSGKVESSKLTIIK
ncbi:Lactococcus bacteriophage repressor [Moritella viscosa]|uniref:Lactococcus bacteriophage repressor n=1 Tax=Moritella viscosa TaxID=80854 RepID=A0A1K9YKZ8_9GAMM|nr:Lactococcus bacteriophage repressor [Moritella viscosa]SGY82957.1 Lactococcus bacteriophage repressor [Moritella viscosa]SHN96745.1 Lactococcus bacteriophage repressor [Moritella viscosa]SHN96747.1 Lactococcus bacteriophage repressor [Moritella viscosa]SHN96806.1 Lactococcus bacteriophage repressor [Moritella viscosa]